MPKINFTDVEDARAFSTIPPDKYLVMVGPVRPKKTQSADEMWSYPLEVLDGPHAGHCIWDNIVFSQKAMKRAKHILEALRFDVTGEVDITQGMIWGKACRVTVEIETYDDKGTERARNKIAFAGYEALTEEEASEWEKEPGDEGDEL